MRPYKSTSRYTWGYILVSEIKVWKENNKHVEMIYVHIHTYEEGEEPPSTQKYDFIINSRTTF